MQSLTFLAALELGLRLWQAAPPGACPWTPDRRGQSHDAYLWGYHALRENAIVLEFSLSRSGAILHEFFPKNWSGEVQTDGASMYPRAFKHRPGILHTECIGLHRYVLGAIKADEKQAC